MKDFYKQIDPNSPMFDFENFYKYIAETLPHDCRIVEVGLANCKSLIFLTEKLFNIGKSVDRIIGVDSMAYGGAHQRNEIIKNLVLSGVGNKIELMDMGSLDASCHFNDEYLDFVFIDSAHTFEMTKAEIRLWIKKLKNGGILAGHDFYEHAGVKDAVNELINPKDITIVETSNGYGIWTIRKSPELKIN